MFISFHRRCWLLLLFLFVSVKVAVAASIDKHLPTQYTASPPPSAQLIYNVTADYGPLTLSGNAQVEWRNQEKRFSVRVLTLANLLGMILDSTSEGVINGHGLNPRHLTETRFRKKTHTVTFDPQKRVVRFSSSSQMYPLKGGEQDRTSITWQLVAMTRAAPEKLAPGTQWTFFVAGRKDAEIWSFQVMQKETVNSALGKVSAIHIAKLPSAKRKGQTLDVWLAPSLECYPVKMVFTDEKGLKISQTLVRIHQPQPQTATLQNNP